MTRPQSGFTLIELLVVIGILSTLMAVLLPRIIGSQRDANVFADAANLRNFHYQQYLSYKQKKFPWPKEGGARFVLAPWVKGVCERTAENRDRYFTPDNEAANPRYGELSKLDPSEIWRDFEDIGPDDTDYLGRIGDEYRTMHSGNEAIMANILPDGTVNVLMGSGSVRTLEPGGDELAGIIDEQAPADIEYGPNSRVELLRKLTR